MIRLNEIFYITHTHHLHDIFYITHTHRINEFFYITHTHRLNTHTHRLNDIFYINNTHRLNDLFYITHTHRLTTHTHRLNIDTYVLSCNVFCCIYINQSNREGKEVPKTKQWIMVHYSKKREGNKKARSIYFVIVNMFNYVGAILKPYM